MLDVAGTAGGCNPSRASAASEELIDVAFCSWTKHATRASWSELRDDLAEAVHERIRLSLSGPHGSFDFVRRGVN